MTPRNACHAPISELAQRSAYELFAYLGSTCDRNVQDGACINENVISDIEYPVLAEVPKLRAALSAAFPDIVRADAEYLLPVRRLADSGGSCKDVHKNRFCSQFEAGDISLDVGGTVVRTSHELVVRPGDTGTFVVHNNGIFGATFIRQQVGADTVTLDPTPLGITAPGLVVAPFQGITVDTVKLRHYLIIPGTDSPGSETYKADSTVRFRVSADAEEGEEATFTFTVDDKTVGLRFLVAKSVVRITPSEATLSRGDSQRFTASLENPPDGQIAYEWELDRRAGTLSAANGTSVDFTAGGGEVDSPRDQIRVAAYLIEGADQRRLLGRGSAGINIAGVHINPTAAALSPGDSQTFTAEVVGTPPDLLLSYQWEVGDGLGALSNPTQAQVEYTAKSTVVPPQNGSLKVTVFVGEGPLLRKLGESTVAIVIFRPGTHKVVVTGSDIFDNILLHGFLFDPSSGQLSPSAGAPLQFPSLNFGDGEVTLRPDGKVGFLPRYSDAFENSVEVFQIDPTSGALNSLTTIKGADLRQAVACGNNSLYLSQSSPLPTLRYSLDAQGNPSPTAFTVPGDTTVARQLLLLPGADGLDLALFAKTGTQFFGFRVSAGLVSAESVTGSPFTPPTDRGMAVLHPNRRYLLFAQNADIGGGQRRLDCIEVNPNMGDFVGLRGTLTIADTELGSVGSITVNAAGLAVLGIGDHAWAAMDPSRDSSTTWVCRAGNSTPAETICLTSPQTVHPRQSSQADGRFSGMDAQQESVVVVLWRLNCFPHPQLPLVGHFFYPAHPLLGPALAPGAGSRTAGSASAVLRRCGPCSRMVWRPL